MTRPISMRAAMIAVGLAVALAALIGVPGRAAPSAQVTADEPQYLLTAGALFDRQDLDIGPDLGDESWRAYHAAELPQQTAELPGGQRLSPHDPLLPVVLAVPFGLGGWVGAKLALVAMAGLLGALLVWSAVTRFGVAVVPAAVVVAGFGVVPPFAAYGSQIYPELPAALVVTLAVAALTGPADRRSTLVWVLAVVALPWLAVKYAPVAAAFALVGLVRLPPPDRQRLRATALMALLGSGLVFLVVHEAIYGGPTVYAVGNHFADGELTVMGASPDYASRTQRLVGLLVDRDFGLVAWAPAFLLAAPAFGALARRRPPGWIALALPLAAGWCNASFLALTMHGWWWPGRQVVVVLPLVVLAVAWWSGTVVRSDRWRRPFVAASAFGLLSWAWLQSEVRRGTSTVIVDFASTSNPLSQLWRLTLPDLRVLGPLDLARLVAWSAVLLGGVALGWQHAREPRPPADRSPDPLAELHPTTHEVQRILT